jgi:hypothetical protein
MVICGWPGSRTENPSWASFQLIVSSAFYPSLARQWDWKALMKLHCNLTFSTLFTFSMYGDWKRVLNLCLVIIGHQYFWHWLDLPLCNCYAFIQFTSVSFCYAPSGVIGNLFTLGVFPGWTLQLTLGSQNMLRWMLDVAVHFWAKLGIDATGPSVPAPVSRPASSIGSIQKPPKMIPVASLRYAHCLAMRGPGLASGTPLDTVNSP